MTDNSNSDWLSKPHISRRAALRAAILGATIPGALYLAKAADSADAADNSIYIPGPPAFLELGSDWPGKEANAGKISYRQWSDALDIVGAGDVPGYRKVKIWDDLYIQGLLNLRAYVVEPESPRTWTAFLYARAVNGQIKPYWKYANGTAQPLVARSATLVVAASNASPQSKLGADFVCDGTDDEVEIQAAIDTLPSSGGRVVLTEGTFNLSSGITISGTNRQMHFDAKVAKLAYSGTGTAVTVDCGGADAKTFIDISDLQATGSAVGSSTAVGVYWHAYWGQGNITVRDFRAGKGLQIYDSSNYRFSYLRIQNCKIGIWTDHDASFGLFDYYVYRLESGCGITGGIALEASGSSANLNLCVFNNWNCSNYSGNSFTVVKADHFDFANVTILCWMLEDSIASGLTSYLADLTASSHRGVIQVGHFEQAMLNGGSLACKGNCINIRALAGGGKNLCPPFVFEAASTDYFTTYNATQSIDTGGARQTTNSLKIDSYVDGDILIDVFPKKLFPAPGSAVTLQFAVKANQPGILLQATLATFDSSDTLQQPTSSPWFEIVAADTWYLVSLPASIFKVPADAAKGHLKFTIDGATVDGSSVINLSETCVFADEAKPALTSNNGTATLANGNTIVTVDHGLGVTPSAGNIMVTPIEEWGNMTQFWVGTCNSNQFDICADQDPGQDVDFAWKATIA